MARITGLFFALLSSVTASLAQASVDWSNRAEAEKAFDAAAKNVRVLPAKSFRILPKEIVSVLERRRCQILQDDTAREGEITNVIRGSFLAPDSSDWAVLCKGNEDSYILVFSQGNADHPSKLAPERVIDSLEGVGSDRIGFVRRIRTLDPQRFANYYARGRDRKVVLTHDAISDAMSDRFESVFYWESGKWKLVQFHASE